MTLQDLGNIGEFIAAVAVVVSLLYLAAQIRQNTRSVQASVYESTNRASSDALTQLGLDTEAAGIYLAGAQDYEALSEKDRLRFHAMLLATFNNFETLFYHHQRRNVDPELWSSRVVRLRWMVRAPGVAAWWSRTRPLFGESFQQFVDGIAAEQDKGSRPAS